MAKESKGTEQSVVITITAEQAKSLGLSVGADGVADGVALVAKALKSQAQREEGKIRESATWQAYKQLKKAHEPEFKGYFEAWVKTYTDKLVAVAK